jgi:hypothetical protein
VEGLPQVSEPADHLAHRNAIHHLHRHGHKIKPHSDISAHTQSHRHTQEEQRVSGSRICTCLVVSEHTGP